MKKIISLGKLNIVLALAVALSGLFMASAPAPASAAPLEVSQDESGTTGWDIGPIMPGESGYQTVEIKNTGSSAATLNIWLGNIGGREGTPLEFVEGTPSATGDLARYLLLDLSADGLTSSFAMPATVDMFPTEVSTTDYLYLARIGSDQTVSLTWHWLLPEETGNDVQGDSLSFDINYTLNEIPPVNLGRGGGGGGAASPSPTPAATQETTITPPPPTETEPSIPEGQIAEVRFLDLVVHDFTASAPVADTGELLETLFATTPDQAFSLTIDSGTRLYISNEDRADGLPVQLDGITIPEKIVVSFLDEAYAPTLPPGWINVSPFIDINGVTGGIIHGISMDAPAHIVIQYDLSLLPDKVDSLATFYYSPRYGWTQLLTPEGFIAEAGQAAADADHFSLFVVLAREGKEPPLPAFFEISGLKVDPPRITIDQSSEVKFRVTNTGGIAGQYTVVVKVNDEIHKTQSVRLEAGESRQIHLILSPGINGVYSVEVSGEMAELIVDPAGQVDVAEISYWWLWLMVIGIAIIILAVLRRRQQKAVQEA
ncbi:MAG: hypothetical protein JXA46_02140 [Dehalococcoidales bacterium]|nr:hypothetical protein [Dehalococcoidales bacterium]